MQIKRRDPGISRLVKSYNDLCAEMAHLVSMQDAPLGAKVPEPLQREGLFQLDVDDSIWQDIGLSEEHDGDVPRWIGDDDVRQGIKWMLQLERCSEEESRLMRERLAMQAWMVEEWNCTEMAFRKAGKSIFKGMKRKHLTLKQKLKVCSTSSS